VIGPFRLLIIDDDLGVREYLSALLGRFGHSVSTAASGEEALENLATSRPDLITLDVVLEGMDGIETLRRLKKRIPDVPVVMISGHGHARTIVEAMQLGAADFLRKPFEVEELQLAFQRALETRALRREVEELRGQATRGSGDLLLASEDGRMREVRETIEQVADTDITVMIRGESGTGKELVARALYRESPRAHAPFIKVNCAAIPENLIESEFFGHEKGAFTGASNRREGRFELAHGGTILLDEVSEISSQVQAKLLRVLQEQELERVGGNRTIKVDVRVLATTNRQLEESVLRKEFRQDLFFRLNVFPIHVPPLRDRAGDLTFLAQKFAQRFSRKHGVKVHGLSADCMNALERHDWPGNVRELQNVIERAVILCGDSGLLEADQLGFTPARAPSAEEAASSPTITDFQAAPDGEFISLAELEKRHIFAALDRTKGNRTHAAKSLGICIRTLRNKLNEYGGHGKTVRSVDRAAGP
jgi:DNA-binding NtrC family response regulator